MPAAILPPYTSTSSATECVPAGTPGTTHATSVFSVQGRGSTVGTLLFTLTQVAFFCPTRCTVGGSDALPDLASATECRRPGRFQGRAVGPRARGRTIRLSAQVDALIVGVSHS